MQGLTTAARLWLVAAAGLAAGCGTYATAVAATTVASWDLVLFRRVEAKSWHVPRRRMTVLLAREAERGSEIRARFGRSRVIVGDADEDRRVGRGGAVLSFDVEFHDVESKERMFGELSLIAGVRRVRMRRTG